jgi:DNA-directed RNA polymerase subunit RPC12/RpoP
MLFIIPAPLAAPQAAMQPAPPFQPPSMQPPAPMTAAAPSALPQVGPKFASAGVAVAERELSAPAVAPAEPEILHIPCPNGHELDTPRDMLGQEVLCPHCSAQFLLREKDSVEYKRKKQTETEAKDRKRGQLWLNWAIAIAVLVLIGLITLIVFTSG